MPGVDVGRPATVHAEGLVGAAIEGDAPLDIALEIRAVDKAEDDAALELLPGGTGICLLFRSAKDIDAGALESSVSAALGLVMPPLDALRVSVRKGVEVAPHGAGLISVSIEVVEAELPPHLLGAIGQAAGAIPDADDDEASPLARIGAAAAGATLALRVAGTHGAREVAASGPGGLAKMGLAVVVNAVLPPGFTERLRALAERFALPMLPQGMRAVVAGALRLAASAPSLVGLVDLTPLLSSAPWRRDVGLQRLALEAAAVDMSALPPGAWAWTYPDLGPAVAALASFLASDADSLVGARVLVGGALAVTLDAAGIEHTDAARGRPAAAEPPVRHPFVKLALDAYRCVLG